MKILLSWIISFFLHSAVLALIVFLSIKTLPQSEALEVDVSEIIDEARALIDAPPGMIIHETKIISAHKVADPNRPFGGRTDEEEERFKNFAENGGVIRSRERLAEGPKTRFGHTLSSGKYTTSDLAGHFRNKEGEDIVIVDARWDPSIKSLMLYIKEDNSMRKLEPMGQYAYFYGPSITETEPVEGTMLFVADGDVIYRIIWMKTDSTASYPLRVGWGEEE